MRWFFRSMAVVTLFASHSVGGLVFTGVGGLRTSNISTSLDSLSADGSTVVGASLNDDGKFEAYRWTESGGMEALGMLDSSLSNRRSRGFGVSADGSVIAGESPSRNPTISLKPVRWNSSGVQAVGAFAGVNPSGFARDVDDSGVFIVGRSGSPDGTRAFRWSEAGGTVSMGDLAGGNSFSEGRGISGDGQVVVGYSSSSNGNEAFRWTESGGIMGLGDLAGGSFSSFAEDASKDGSVVVGFSSSGSGTEAFRWTASGGMQGLGDLAGGSFLSAAYTMNADGSLIGGFSETASGNEAFIWDATNGMQRAQDYLASFGLSTTGWTLTTVYGISDDGMTLAGSGINPDGRNEGWFAQVSAVPEPSSAIGLLMLLSTILVRRKRRTSDFVGGCE